MLKGRIWRIQDSYWESFLISEEFHSGNLLSSVFEVSGWWQKTASSPFTDFFLLWTESCAFPVV